MKKLNKFLKRFEQKSVKLTPIEKYSIRLGYMGSGVIMLAPHLLPGDAGIILYIISGILLTPQVIVAKQWNLVAINLNVVVAYTILFFAQ